MTKTYRYQPARLTPRGESPGIVPLSANPDEEEEEATEEVVDDPVVVDPEDSAPLPPLRGQAKPGTTIDHRPAQGERWRLPDGQVIVIEELMERHGGAVLRGKSEGEWHDLREALGPLPHHGAREDDPSSGGFLVG